MRTHTPGLLPPPHLHTDSRWHKFCGVPADYTLPGLLATYHSTILDGGVALRHCCCFFPYHVPPPILPTPALPLRVVLPCAGIYAARELLDMWWVLWRPHG